jgi:hypothetical protein
MNLHTFRRWFLAGTPGGVFWAALAICMVGAIVVWARAPRFRPFVLWVPLYYWALPAAGARDFMWYYIPPLWVAFVLGAAGLQATAGAFPGRSRRPASLVLALAAVCGYGLVSFHGVEPLLMPGNPYLRFHQMLAGKVAELARPGDMVAAPEVGCIAYFSGCRILDIRAVTCPEVIVQARARNLGAMLRHWQPDFVVILGGDGDPAIQHAYTSRFRARYWNGMDYVIWQRVVPPEAATAAALSARSSQHALPADQAQQPATGRAKQSL